eukprot:SM000004S14971  [mRNA]  locus=s4:490039:491613:+ [translate_table: standard]
MAAGNVVERAWRRYLRALRERPLQTKLFGLLFGGPSLHIVHRLLDRIFRSAQDTPTVLCKVAVEQLTYGPIMNLANMFFIARVIEGGPSSRDVPIAAMMESCARPNQRASPSYNAGRPMPAVREKIRRDYPSVQINGWRLWPLVSIINYKYVPMNLRALYVNCVAVIWTTFLILRSQSGLLR